MYLYILISILINSIAGKGVINNIKVKKIIKENKYKLGKKLKFRRSNRDSNYEK